MMSLFFRLRWLLKKTLSYGVGLYVQFTETALTLNASFVSDCVTDDRRGVSSFQQKRRSIVLFFFFVNVAGYLNKSRFSVLGYRHRSHPACRRLSSSFLTGFNARISRRFSSVVSFCEEYGVGFLLCPVSKMFQTL